MKKSQLKHIIRESIRELMNEQFQMPVMYVYRGCNLGGQYAGVGDSAGQPPLDGFIPNQMVSGAGATQIQTVTGQTLLTSPPNSLDEMLTNNSGMIHSVWGSPSPGNVIKMYTCSPGNPICMPTCLEYLGTDTSYYNGNYDTFAFGGSSNLTQLMGTFGSCNDCQANTNPIIYGCTDPTAVNYDSAATNDDGSCCFIAGCTDPLAQNYDPNACQEDNSCTYYTPPEGCTDLTAFNYDPNAVVDDGSCCYIAGCMISNALNYNPNACVDDGSCCTAEGCTDPNAWNYVGSTASTWTCHVEEECNFGFNCIDTYPEKPINAQECKPGDSSNPGQFETLQDCNNSGCGPQRADTDKPGYGGPTTSVNPFGGSIGSTLTGTPLEPDPIAPIDIDKLQRRAGIKK